MCGLQEFIISSLPRLRPFIQDLIQIILVELPVASLNLWKSPDAAVLGPNVILALGLGVLVVKLLSNSRGLHSHSIVVQRRATVLHGVFTQDRHT